MLHRCSAKQAVVAPFSFQEAVKSQTDVFVEGLSQEKKIILQNFSFLIISATRTDEMLILRTFEAALEVSVSEWRSEGGQTSNCRALLPTIYLFIYC